MLSTGRKNQAWCLQKQPASREKNVGAWWFNGRTYSRASTLLFASVVELQSLDERRPPRLACVGVRVGDVW